MGYAIDWSDLEQRIQDQKAALLDTSQNMDPERLKFLVETYDECKGESVFITRAKLFEKVLNNKKIYLDGNPIVGSLAGGRAMIYAYPEWQCNWVKDDLDSEKLALSSLGEVRFSDETKEILKKVYKTWKGKTTYDRANKLYKELYGGNAELLVKCGWIYPVNDNSTGSGVADYPAMLTKGIRGILEEVEAAYRALPKHATNWTKIEFYRACKIALNAVIAYAHRYAVGFPSSRPATSVKPCSPSGSRTAASRSNSAAAATPWAVTVSTCIRSTRRIWMRGCSRRSRCSPC